MSLIHNANEFLIKYRRICDDYERVFKPHLDSIRIKYKGQAEEMLIDDNSEIHLRIYLVNSLLAALNWRLDKLPSDGLPNLIPEAPIRSHERKTIRFFDYLGLEEETNNPLLIVETKRPSTGLPQAFKTAPTYSEIIAQGLRGEILKGQWNEWLKCLTDYVLSAYSRTQKIPKRVVITNGEWLIIFLDPVDAFLGSSSCNSTQILVLEGRLAIERRYIEVFRNLEYNQVLKEVPPLTPSELPFYLDGKMIERAMNGLRLLYIEQAGIYQSTPVIKVAPVVLLRSRYGGWFRVHTPTREYELPNENDQLPTHFIEVEKAARNLLEQANRKLRISIQPMSLIQHYNDEDGFEPIRGVVEQKKNDFFLVTGDKTHYLLVNPSTKDCPHHEWSSSQKLRVPCNPGPIMTRSTNPRSFFFSGEIYHCTHRDVSTAKSCQITESNKTRCGLRSGEEGHPFCEIWLFEQYLCCRSCVFGEVCTKTGVFHLPCEQRT